MKAAAEIQVENQADAVRADILRHATDLFSHYGFNKTNIGDIADRCAMSPGNLYRYYRNKQAIGLAVVRCHFEMTEVALETVFMIPEGTSEERIRKFIATGITHIADECGRNPKIVELAEFLCDDEDGIEILQEHIQWKRDRLAGEIERGITSGEFAPRDVELTASAILNAFKAFTMPMTLTRWRDPETIMPEMHAILDLICPGLRADR